MTTSDVTSINIEELIAIVAKKHKVLLSADDPIFLTVTLNEMILNHHLEMVNNNMDGLKSNLETLYHRQSEENKALAKRMINASLTYSVKSVSEAVSNASKKLIGEMEIVEQRIAKDNRQSINQFKTISKVMLSCAAVSLICVAVILVKTLGI